jgi:hypothetical protein
VLISEAAGLKATRSLAVTAVHRDLEEEADA